MYQRSLETFSVLDDWNNHRFHAEMNGVRNLISVIRQSSEIEIKIPHEMILLGEKFYVDLSALAIQSESEAPHVSLQEKSSRSRFMSPMFP